MGKASRDLRHRAGTPILQIPNADMAWLTIEVPVARRRSDASTDDFCPALDP